jgi:hypothetical protein
MRLTYVAQYYEVQKNKNKNFNLTLWYKYIKYLDFTIILDPTFSQDDKL